MDDGRVERGVKVVHPLRDVERQRPEPAAPRQLHRIVGHDVGERAALGELEEQADVPAWRTGKW